MKANELYWDFVQAIQQSNAWGVDPDNHSSKSHELLATQADASKAYSEHLVEHADFFETDPFYGPQLENAMAHKSRSSSADLGGPSL